MPLAVREAMLRGIEENEIIVGAYVDNASGGVCPMLAAHRNGERTSFGTFARAWDSFTRANPKKPRHATRREISVLRGYLERTLIGDGVASSPLGAQVAEVQALRRRHAEADAREGREVTIEELLANVIADEDADETPAVGVGDRPRAERGADDHRMHRVPARG